MGVDLAEVAVLEEVMYLFVLRLFLFDIYFCLISIFIFEILPSKVMEIRVIKIQYCAEKQSFRTHH